MEKMIFGGLFWCVVLCVVAPFLGPIIIVGVMLSAIWFLFTVVSWFIK